MIKMRSDMANAYTQTKTQRAHQTKAAQNQAAKHEPEWGDEKFVTRNFGLTHTPLFNLRKAGKIRSISTRGEGQKYGKRLFYLQSIRDYFAEQERAELAMTAGNGGAL